MNDTPWGPPQEQPDSEGWWAFEGNTPFHSKTRRLFFEIYRQYREDEKLFVEIHRSNECGYYANQLTGRWWRLTMPWEVTK